MVQTYNEFRVVYDNPNKKDAKIISKEATKRATVRIDKHTADINNGYSKSTGLLYELAKEQPEDKKQAKPKNK